VEKLVEACQRERHAHSKDNQSHRPHRRVVQKAAARACSAVRHKHHHDGGSERHCNQETNEA